MKISILFLSIWLAFSSLAYATGIDKNTAQMQAMDKITGRVSVIDVPVNGNIEFGTLSIVVRSCKTRPVEETPDNFAFVDITDKNQNNEEINIFKGWMISSSPATHAVEHPIYDVWLLQCLDTDFNKELLLNEEQLAIRDNLPMQKKLSHTAEQPQTGELNMAEPINEMNEQTHDNNIGESTIEFSYDEEDIVSSTFETEDEDIAEDINN